MRRFTDEVCGKLKYYVYLYVDPASGDVFYVGKGAGNRAFSHLDDDSESRTCDRIRAIRRDGGEPQIQLLAHGLDEQTAYQIEASAIDLFGPEKLTNAVRGWKTGLYGRMTVDQVRALYAAPEVPIKHPCVLIRINERFRYGMSPIELYDATRGVWRIGANRDTVRFALSVFDGVVQEVYEIAGWFPAGTTMSTRSDTANASRWEFVGRIAHESIRHRYRFKAVRAHFPQGAQNPVRYVCVGLQSPRSAGLPTPAVPAASGRR